MLSGIEIFKFLFLTTLKLINNVDPPETSLELPTLPEKSHATYTLNHKTNHKSS